MKNINVKIRLLLMVSIVALSSCEKFLDKKPDQKLAVPITVEHFQALLNENAIINISAAEGEIAAGDFYLTDATFNNLGFLSDQNLYQWKDAPLTDYTNNGWRMGYTTIYNANVVLEGLNKIKVNGNNTGAINNVKGQAYFYRANSLLEMVSIWAVAYDEKDMNALGIPIRTGTDFNEKSVRATLVATYNQINADLERAISLLPTTQPTKFWPTKPAALGMLARSFLLMRNYKEAYKYADSCLKLYPRLLDYNMLNTSLNYPILLNNEEVIFYKSLLMLEPIDVSVAKVNPEILTMYAANDLRKLAFFRVNTDGSYRFKGSYRGSSSNFSGIATDEVLLIRAESAAREGNLTRAIADLNSLLSKRFSNKLPYVAVVSTNQTELVNLILTERRKELLFRGLRWGDIKRLNKEGRQISLNRIINGQNFSLPANDPRFALAIPQDVIELSGIPQNKR